MAIDNVMCADLSRNGIVMLVSDRNWLVVTVASHYKKYPPNHSAQINRLQIPCSQLPCVRHQPGTAQTTERAHGCECTPAIAADESRLGIAADKRSAILPCPIPTIPLCPACLLGEARAAASLISSVVATRARGCGLKGCSGGSCCK